MGEHRKVGKSERNVLSILVADFGYAHIMDDEIRAFENASHTWTPFHLKNVFRFFSRDSIRNSSRGSLRKYFKDFIRKYLPGLSSGISSDIQAAFFLSKNSSEIPPVVSSDVLSGTPLGIRVDIPSWTLPGHPLEISAGISLRISKEMSPGISVGIPPEILIFFGNFSWEIARIVYRCFSICFPDTYPGIPLKIHPMVPLGTLSQKRSEMLSWEFSKNFFKNSSKYFKEFHRGFRKEFFQIPLQGVVQEFFQKLLQEFIKRFHRNCM